MIDYQAGVWHINLLFKLRGSVLPIAFAWAMPSAVFAYVLAHHTDIFDDIRVMNDFSGVNAMWSAHTFILGFLVVFRTQQAYGRYWEGATLLRQARAEWFNAFSSLIAFSTNDLSKKTEVECFQHHLVRLLSILNCVALQTITDMADDDFDTLDFSGMGVQSLEFLASKKELNQRMEILIQWIQRLVVDNMQAGILTVPAPILSRFFQEMSRGAVCLNQARNLTEIPFPFPYAQLLTLLLTLNCIVTPIVSAIVMPNGIWGSLFTFVLVFSFWGTNYIAAEIESPYGDDPNDLPLGRLQEDVNASLWTLLEVPAQCPPSFHFNRDVHRSYSTRKGSFSIVEGEEVTAKPSQLIRLGSRTSYGLSFGLHDSSQRDRNSRSSLSSFGSFASFSTQTSNVSHKSKKHARKPGFASSHPQKPISRLHGRSGVFGRYAPCTTPSEQRTEPHCIENFSDREIAPAESQCTKSFSDLTEDRAEVVDEPPPRPAPQLSAAQAATPHHRAPLEPGELDPRPSDTHGFIYGHELVHLEQEQDQAEVAALPMPPKPRKSHEPRRFEANSWAGGSQILTSDEHSHSADAFCSKL